MKRGVLALFVPALCCGILYAEAGRCVSGGCRDGQGTMRYPDGTTYTGAWENGLRRGYGSLYLADGTRKVRGLWKEGMIVSECLSGDCENGSGAVRSIEGYSYTGEFRNGKKHGKGRLSYPNMMTYTGEFRDDYFNGLGKSEYLDGSRYSGQWKDNAMHGSGTFTYADGKKYVGTFRYGKKHGTGKLLTPEDSIISSGLWEDDEFAGK